MRDEYDFSKGEPNPYVTEKEAKVSISIRLNKSTVDYFKSLAAKSDIPYQTLINAYLTDCCRRDIKPQMTWTAS